MDRALKFQITKVWARNFRSIAFTSANIRPLTVLVGRNMSGKSNVMDVLRFLRDAMRDDLELAVTAREGVGAVRRWQPGGRRHDIELGVIAQGIVNWFGHFHDYRVTYELVIASNKDGAYRIKREQAEVLHPSFTSTRDNRHTARFINKKGVLESRGLQVLESQNGRTDSAEANLILPVFRHPYRPKRRAEISQPPWIAQMALTELYRSLRGMQFYQLYPNAMRMPQKAAMPFQLNALGENLATVLRKLLKEDLESATRLRAVLPHLIPDVTDVRVRSAGGYLVVQLQHGGDSKSQEQKPWFDSSQESDGVLRLLGVLVALYQRPSPYFMGIEEPDLAVHPGLFGVLADVLQEGAQNSQLLVTTHSPDLIDQLPTECLRVVELAEGTTSVGSVTASQMQAVKERLFSPGELHRMEGLRIGALDA